MLADILGEFNFFLPVATVKLEKNILSKRSLNLNILPTRILYGSLMKGGGGSHIYKKKIFSDKHAYFVTDRHPILLL